MRHLAQSSLAIFGAMMCVLVGLMALEPPAQYGAFGFAGALVLLAIYYVTRLGADHRKQ